MLDMHVLYMYCYIECVCVCVCLVQSLVSDDVSHARQLISRS